MSGDSRPDLLKSLRVPRDATVRESCENEDKSEFLP
jgi:hypothetical protein